jgi:hypothetical protein
VARWGILLGGASLVAIAAACSLGALDGFAGTEGAVDASDDAAGDTTATPEAAPVVDAADAADAADPLAASLVAHWAFDDGTGTTADDSSGHGHHAVLRGLPSWTTGKYGGAIKLDGIAQYVEVLTLAGAAFPTNGTIAIWAKSPFPGTDNRPLFDRYDLDRPHLHIRQYGGPKLQIEGQLVDAGSSFTTSFDVPPDAWFRVVVTWDLVSRQGNIYLGDTLVATKVIPPTWEPSGQQVVFGRAACCGGFAGDIDDVRLYDRPLTASEVAQLPP